MIKRISIAVFLLVLVLFGCFLFKTPDPDKQDKPESPHLSAPKEDVLPVKKPQEEAALSPEEVELLERFTPEEIENLKYSHQAAQAANQNVIFYGQCLDQDGNPVEGVRIEAEVTKMRKSMLTVVATESFKYKESLLATSDANGRFEFKDEGSYLALRKMEKPGYVAATSTLRGYQFGQILVGDTMAGLHKANSLKPVIFTLWKKGDGSSAVVFHDKNGFKPEIGMQKSDLGKTVYFDLSKRVKAIGPTGNTLEVIANNAGNRRRDPISQKIVGSMYPAWSYTLRISGGGLVQTDDTFLYRPPETGYEEFFRLEVPEGEGCWMSKVDGQKFYFKTAEGNYGAFVLAVYASADGSMSFHFDKLYYNPTGERDLEK